MDNRIPHEFIERVLWIQNETQLMHWLEESWFRHEALDSLRKELVTLLDKLVEVVIGVYGRENLFISDDLLMISKTAGQRMILNMLNNILGIIENWREDFEKEKGILNILDDLETLVLKNKYLFQLS